VNSTSKQPTPRQQGEQQRKIAPRTELAQWNPAARKQDPLKLLERSMRGRLPALFPLKTERMAASPFGFFRGAVPIMAYDLSLSPHTGILSQLCGDAHVQNFGAYCGISGAMIFDINDFDETICGPFEWDLKRMATSILLAGQSAKIGNSGCMEGVDTFLEVYCELMQRFSRMPILEVVRFQVHRLASVTPISKILYKAERETPLLSLERLTVETPKGRVFKSNPPVLRPITGAEAKTVLASLSTYIDSLLPERRRLFAKFRPIAVAFKVVGTGSVALRDYCVLLEGNGSADPLFLQIKQEAQSAYTGYLPKSAVTTTHDGKRAVEGQRAMQIQSDPLLGWTTIANRSYLVRQLNDHKASIDIATLKATGLAEYATVCGEMLARGHARSGDPRVIAGYIGTGRRFKQAISDFATIYAKQTVADWKTLLASRK
jgi:uncharacterized protein (DUF2252 family)